MVADHGVQDREELAHGGDQGDLGGMAGGSQALVEGGQDGVAAHRGDLVIEGESYRARLKPSLKAAPASRKATGTHG
jgi:hypothetical protein